MKFNICFIDSVGKHKRNRFCAVNPDGSIKWEFPTNDRISSTPAIDEYGNIYFACRDHYFYSIKSDGTLNWKYLTDLDRLSRHSPIIAEDGTIYFIADSAYAFTREGNVKWTLALGENINTHHRPVPAVDQNGNIYMGLDEDSLSIVRPNGTIFKKIPDFGLSITSPVIDEYNNAYYVDVGAGPPQFISLDGNGKIRWSDNLLQMGFFMIGASTPSVSKDNNTVYIPLEIYLVAFNTKNGTITWDWFIAEKYGQLTNSAAIDSDGNIYVGSDNYLLQISSQGELIKEVNLGVSFSFISSPVIGNNRIVYITAVSISNNDDWYLYAIE